MGLEPLSIQPGFVKTDSPYSLRGRWVDGDKVRFVGQYPEKIGGWTKLVDGPFDGMCRALFAWDDFNLNRYIAIGTTCRLYLADADSAVTDITPIETNLTLGADPIETVNGSSEITVAHGSHGLAVGRYVIISGADPVGGIDPNGEWAITEVVDTGHYKVDVGDAATSDATGGGAAVEVDVLLPCGDDTAALAGGWGTLTWGSGTWGTARTLTVSLQLPTFWFLENYGQNLMALRGRGDLYQWTTAGGRAAKVTNSPSGNAMFITEERFIMVLGSGGDLMRVAWCDQNDPTVWTPLATNTAGIRNLQGGSRLIAGKALAPRIAIIWSDLAAFQMVYSGDSFVYQSRRIGFECGLIGPKAFAIANQQAYWMSGNGFHVSNGGDVQRILNSQDVHEWVFRRISLQQSVKTTCLYLPRFNEIWWGIVPAGETEPTEYVKYNLATGVWDHGTLERQAWTVQATINHRPLAAYRDQAIYWHENGQDADGVAMEAWIKSAPADLDEGNAFMDIWGYVPDFHRLSGAVDVEIESFDYPNRTTMIDSAVKTVTANLGKIDFHTNGRQVALTLRSNELGGDFRLGRHRIDASAAGRRV